MDDKDSAGCDVFISKAKRMAKIKRRGEAHQSVRDKIQFNKKAIKYFKELELSYNIEMDRLEKCGYYFIPEKELYSGTLNFYRIIKWPKEKDLDSKIWLRVQPIDHKRPNHEVLSKRIRTIEEFGEYIELNETLEKDFNEKTETKNFINKCNSGSFIKKLVKYFINNEQI